MWNLSTTLRAARVTVACLLNLTLCVTSARAGLVWEDFFTDEQSIADGTLLNTGNGINVTINRLVFSDSDGGTFDLATFGNSDYFTFEGGGLGGHTGLLEASFDNQNNDPADYLTLTLSFSSAITNLQFSLLDVDTGSFDDAVEVFYNGTQNVRDNPAFFTTGLTNTLDDETYMHGFEGNRFNSPDGLGLGNINFNFGATQITSLRIKYFSTDDADSDPGGQKLGLSDLMFSAVVPEPSAVAMMGLFALAILTTAWKRRPVATR